MEYGIMTLPRWTSARALGIAMAIVVGLLSRPLWAQEITVPAVVIGVSVSIWPAIVAREKGFFKEEGLDVDIVTTGSSARSLQQVAAGVASFGSSSMVDTMRAIESGAELKAFTNSLAVGTHSLIAAKSVKSFADLKGKRVMTGGQGDITNLWWKAAARKNGLDPNKDVELIYSGSTANRMSALFAGGIEATVLSTPQSFKAIQAGWTDLGPVAPYLGEFPMMIWHVNSAWAKAHQNAVVSFVKAHNKAIHYMMNPANRQEVSQMLAKASHSELDDALKTWDLCMKIHAFIPDGSISDQAVKRVIETLLESGDIKAPEKQVSAYYDASFVDAAK
jgi:NitT/TauT family transport system substrate-binding protein